MNISEVVTACEENPGVWALVAICRMDRYTAAVRAVRGRAPDLKPVYPNSPLGPLRLPNGSTVDIASVQQPGDAVRRLGGIEAQLIVTDGLGEQDAWYLASRLRTVIDGPPLLGIHALTDEAGV